jgi:hypothetical protein
MGWDYIRPDDGKYRSYGSGHGTDIYFTLEARTTVSPALIGPVDPLGTRNFILTDKWQRVPISRAECGVPILSYDLPGNAIARTLDLVNYEAAMALAHLFIAQLVAPVFSSIHDVEVRLVKVELRHSFETRELGVGEIINRSDGPSPYGTFKERETTAIPLSVRAEVEEKLATGAGCDDASL